MGKELKRMRYFDGLFLNEEDYKLDQEYQRRQQQLHNRYFHKWGIVDGFEVEPSIKATGKIITDDAAAGTAANTEMITKVVTENEKYQIAVPEELTEKERCTIVISKGVALNQTTNPETGESISQQIYIPERTELDLSKHLAGEDIYVCVNYKEVLADKTDIAKGGTEKEIHITEGGQIFSVINKPENEKETIILARAELKLKEIPVIGDNSKPIVIKYINKISYFEADGQTSVRSCAGPDGSVFALEKIIFKLGEEVKEMPFIKGIEQVIEGNSKKGLEVNSAFTNFSGSVTVKGDLVVNGNLINEGIKEKELLVSNCFVQVNSRAETEHWEARNGGLQVYRGESEESPDACIMWSEDKQRWQVGYSYKDKDGNEIYKDFYDIAYGEPWENLIGNAIADDLHKHAKLSYKDGVALEAVDTGNLSMYSNLSMNDRTLWLRSKDNTSHGLGWFGTGKKFAGSEVDGPVLFGLNGGVLGTTENSQKAVIAWNSLGNVGIGVSSPIDDRLEVAGSLCILSTQNPLRITSRWAGNSGIDDDKSAEISNDTENYKALVIAGNRSSKSGVRKVAIWDRLDVNGTLCVNGNMQMTQAIVPSAGMGSNGIVFPNDPGGGGYDSAWIKYYPRTGEACNLEIGISNDGDDHIALVASGNVGIGTVSPADKLDINGTMRIMSGSNPIRFTSAWSGFPDQFINQKSVINQAEICNDTKTFKSLMIAGNKSENGGRRKVSIWDSLDVNGSLKVNGDLTTNCAIVPSAGNTSNSGITFPKDYYGGSGDEAWIRYYSDQNRGGGENMTLEIGINNDGNDSGGYYGGGDRIRLYASGGVYVVGDFFYSSSKDLKENIEKLPSRKAKDILDGLSPVKFNFKGDTERTTLGFIAEEVPAEVAANDQKAISPVEIIAVLTSVVKDQRKNISILQQQVEALSQ